MDSIRKHPAIASQSQYKYCCPSSLKCRMLKYVHQMKQQTLQPHTCKHMHARTRVHTHHTHTHIFIHSFILSFIYHLVTGLLKFALTGNRVKDCCHTASNINTSSWHHIIIYLQLENDTCITDIYSFNLLWSSFGVKSNPGSWT
jgi:hypothetical protein